MNLLFNIFKKTKPQLLLGRWKITHDKKKIDKIVYLANQDHCGPCGYLYNKDSNKTKTK